MQSHSQVSIEMIETFIDKLVDPVIVEVINSYNNEMYAIIKKFMQKRKLRKKLLRKNYRLNKQHNKKLKRRYRNVKRNTKQKRLKKKKKQRRYWIKMQKNHRNRLRRCNINNGVGKRCTTATINDNLIKDTVLDKFYSYLYKTNIDNNSIIKLKNYINDNEYDTDSLCWEFDSQNNLNIILSTSINSIHSSSSLNNNKKDCDTFNLFGKLSSSSSLSLLLNNNKLYSLNKKNINKYISSSINKQNSSSIPSLSTRYLVDQASKCHHLFQQKNFGSTINYQDHDIFEFKTCSVSVYGQKKKTDCNIFIFK